ncbi:uncharacterized protein LOC110063703 isoform X2 [Orbicella faveolata]|uniref:uncharacterized protein LOC110063703 isoform X2 n=1 Tax=Orbicella faveolata TaxID=48498 RepID=UPI0009E5FB50|nr:uncharacterized protein LOC110063703 isoform X2 [Orbicella faveolata]
MNTLKSLVILSLVLAVATGEREKRGLSNWCRAFGCPPDSAFKNRGGSFNKDFRGIPQTFQSPRDIFTTRDKKESVIDHGKSASNYRYEEMRDYLKELSE